MLSLENSKDTKTIKAYKLDLDKLQKVHRRKGIPKYFELKKYMQIIEKNYQLKTILRKYSAIKSFYTFLEMKNIIKENPLNRIKIQRTNILKEEQSVPIDLVEKLIKQAYKALDTAQTDYQVKEQLRNIAMIELVFSTGIRVSELSTIKVEDIDLIKRILVIRGKNNTERIIRIDNKTVLNVLRKYSKLNKDNILHSGCFFVNRSGNSISEQSFRFMVKRLANDAKIGIKITPKTLRSTFLMELGRSENDLEYLKNIAGYRTLQPLQKYRKTNKHNNYLTVGKNPRNKIRVQANF